MKKTTRTDNSKAHRIFVSSTVVDLGEYRHRASQAANKAGYLPVMQEYFSATENPPLDECLERVKQCDLLAVIVAHRYGWIPPAQTGKSRKSITWIECEEAIRRGKSVLAFVVKEDAKWPEEQREDFAIAQALRAGSGTGKLFREVQARVESLKEFKSWLKTNTTCAFFTSPEDLETAVLHALEHWRKPSSVAARVRKPTAERADPTFYLEKLLQETGFIDIRGLVTGDGRAHKFPIGDLYIPLTTQSPEEGHRPVRSDREPTERRLVELDTILGGGNLVVLGDPGAGKSTFLQRTANQFAHAILDGTAAQSSPPIPLFIKLHELLRFITENQDGRTRPKPVTADSPDWLFAFLDGLSTEHNWRVTSAFFKRELGAGRCILLFDGLDEASNRLQREGLTRLVERLSHDYPKATIVVTSRPVSYTGKSVFSSFRHASIEPLEEASIRRFLEHWANAVHRGDPVKAEGLRAELTASVTARPEIRRMARNPVMLTALAVLQWNNKRLPEQRAELYESIVTWLSRARELRPGRLSADRCVAILQELALILQLGLTDKKAAGRQVQVSRKWAAEQISGQKEFKTDKLSERILAAELFLQEEEVDSGIIVSRGEELRFWHLTLQEFLAARALGGMTETEQQEVLLGERGRLYLPEWREVVLLFAGLLIGQGSRKADWFVKSVIDALVKPTLADKARCAGLLGAVARDLAPASYELSDPRYQRLLNDVLAIFELKRSESITVEVRIEAAEALAQAGDPRLDTRHPDRWVRIPEGTFLMGAQAVNSREKNHDPEARNTEAPVHEIFLDAFEMCRFPVTVQEYSMFVADGGYGDSRWWNEGGFQAFKLPVSWDDQLQHPSRPVTGVSWFEASAFAAWCGAMLPTEAQRERAARGVDGRKYPWGNEDPEPSRLNYIDSKIHRPTPVGIYPAGATPYGIHDLAGNVWEWCSDWYGAYPQSSQCNPSGPATDAARGLRGGSWDFDSRYVRSACRLRSAPNARFISIGFRLVRS